MTAVEYCFMLSVILLAVLLAVQHLGLTVKGTFQTINTKIQSNMPTE